MFRMAVGQSDEVEPADAIAAAIEACRLVLGDLRPQAGILFSAFDSFDPSVAVALREAFPDATVMGSTSAAEISSVGGYKEDSLTLAMFASDTVDVTAGIGPALSLDIEAACRGAVAQALGATTKEPKVCIVLAEGFGVDPQQTLEAVTRVRSSPRRPSGAACGRSVRPGRSRARAQASCTRSTGARPSSSWRATWT